MKTAQRQSKTRPKTKASAAELARHLGFSRQYIRQLPADVFVKLPGGLYDLDAGRLGYISWLKDERRQSAKSTAAARVQVARAREIELRTAREEKRLMETDEALAVLDELVGNFKSELSSLPARITRDLGLRKSIEAETDRICHRLADLFSTRASELRAEGAAEAPVDEDDEPSNQKEKA